MKVTVMPIVTGPLGSILKDLTRGLEEFEIGGRVETIHIIALLGSTRKLRRVLETWGKLMWLKLLWKIFSYWWCEKLARSKTIIIIIIIIIIITVLENDTHKLLWDFNIQTDHLISARRPDLIIINKKKEKKICKIVDFAVPADHRIKLKECEKRDKYLDLAKELKKLWNMKVTIIIIVIGAFGTVTKGLLKGPGGFGSWRLSGDHLNNSIIENSQNTEKSRGDSISSERQSVYADVKNSNE